MCLITSGLLIYAGSESFQVASWGSFVLCQQDPANHSVRVARLDTDYHDYWWQFAHTLNFWTDIHDDVTFPLGQCGGRCESEWWWRVAQLAVVITRPAGMFMDRYEDGGQEQDTGRHKPSSNLTNGIVDLFVTD